MVRELSDYLFKAGHHCLVYYFDEIRELTFQCPVHRIHFFSPIKFNDFDIIHSHLLRPDLYCLWHRKKIRNPRLISTLHTAIYHDVAFTHGNLKSWLAVKLWELALRRMDHVVILSSAARDYYTHVGFSNVSIIPNGRDLPAEPPPADPLDVELLRMLKSRYLLLGAVSILDRRKGLDQLIDLLASNPDYACVVVGEGPFHDRLNEMISAHQLSDRFVLLGGRPEGYRYLPHFDILILPSRSEGLPLALLEGMALKVPLVLSDIPEFRAILNSRQAAFFELDNTLSLDSACKSAAERGSETSENSFELYQKRFVVKMMAEAYISLYFRLNNGG